ncbi:hypothetical protein T4E_10287 [Trichinella pseudospiralis]|uniref:Uncharacterized protein n=1 Tax=Trichinella pseudospiralis TaxID=6337 RepID=A0A0V0XEB7_TRIPS|nr:hypothetical protein T4E_10287 [Trichinella pseudospiralis]
MILKPLDGHVENVELKASLKQLYYEAMATDAFPNSYRLNSVALILGIFSATCEASFSTIPLAFGGIAPSVKSYAPLDLLSISNEELLRLFHKAKNFVLQLYSTRSHIIKY